MSSPGKVMFDYVSTHYPDVYVKILETIRPHSIKSITFHFDAHINKSFSVQQLSYLNTHRCKIPQLLLQFVRAVRKRFPCPGDAFGIQLTCRVTKFDTQGVLDKKHFGGSSLQKQDDFNVEYSIRHELLLFTSQTHVFEFSSKREYYSVYLKNNAANVLQRFEKGKICELEVGLPFNKGRVYDSKKKTFHLVLLDSCPLIYVKPQSRIMYRRIHDLLKIFERCDDIEALSDISYVANRCGIVSHYFNLIRVLKRQLFVDGCYSSWAKDILTIVKYQCRSGKPLSLNRDGLAKNTSKSPIEILSFEAPKKNLARLCTMEDESTRRYPVETSADKLFFGQQFNEGSGYCGFGVMSK